MADSPISLRKEGNISIITIDDGKANVFGVPMTTDLSEALDEIDTKEGAVVIEGRDGIFSGGFDLKVINAGDADAGRKMTLGGIKVALKAMDFPRPIVAAVTGHAVAMGAIFNCGLDWRIGAQGKFIHGLNEIKDGLALPLFAIEFPRFRLNPTRYQEAVMRSTMYSPEEAVEVGFLDEVVPADQCREAAFEKAKELAELLPNPGYAISKIRDRGPTKRLIEENFEADLAQTRVDAQAIMG